MHAPSHACTFFSDLDRANSEYIVFSLIHQISFFLPIQQQVLGSKITFLEVPQHSGLADLENLVVFIVGTFWSGNPFCFSFLQHLWYCQPGSGCWKLVESMKSTSRFMTLTAIRFIHLMWVQHCPSFLFLFCILVNSVAVFSGCAYVPCNDLCYCYCSVSCFMHETWHKDFQMHL